MLIAAVSYEGLRKRGGGVSLEFNTQYKVS